MINTVIINGKIYANISDLSEWSINKDIRATGPIGFSRLKKQIQEFREVKPILITPEGIVIGGNTRLRAYKELGYEKLWVSIIDTKNKDDLLKINLLDNDNASFYTPDGLANILSEYNLNLEDYAVDFDEPIILADIDGMVEKPPKEKKKQEITCPSCGHKWKE